MKFPPWRFLGAFIWSFPRAFISEAFWELTFFPRAFWLCYNLRPWFWECLLVRQPDEYPNSVRPSVSRAFFRSRTRNSQYEIFPCLLQRNTTRHFGWAHSETFGFVNISGLFDFWVCSSYFRFGSSFLRSEQSEQSSLGNFWICSYSGFVRILDLFVWILQS